MKTHPERRINGARVAVSAILLNLLTLSTIGQPGPPGETASDRVVQVHREIQSAVVEATYSLYYARKDETEFVSSPYRVVFDRPTHRLRVDRPGYTLISDGADIILVADALPGRHLRMPLEGELTYERLIEVFPDLQNPTPPALVYLLSKEPVSHFVAEGAGGASTLPPSDTQTYLSYPLAQGSHRHSFDRASRRIDSVLIDLDIGQPDLEAVRFHYAFEWSAVDEPVEEETFQIDLRQSQEMTTLATFLSPSGGGGAGGAGPAGQGGGAGGNTLVGLPLPDIELEVLGSDDKIKLSDLDEGVVILECFATWSKASVLDLPALSEFKAWCTKNEHDVRVFGIAVGEQKQQTEKWLSALEKTANIEIDVPILMDSTTEAAMGLKLPTVPRTLVVIDGRIAEVYGGLKPTYLEDLKQGLPDWLDKVKPAKDAPE
jgi:hypothetical protein